ncbi:MAG: ribonuclease III domain-containing protein [Halobacteriota archaeon]
MKSELAELEDRVGYRFKNIALLEEAITTSSFAPGYPNYQRLEFLGDRVVSLILAEKLIVSETLDEGKMTFLKSELEKNKQLANFGVTIGLRSYIRAGKKREEISEKVIADVFEAICGAIYLDSEESAGLKEVERFLQRFDISERIKQEMRTAGNFLPIRNQFENKFREINRCNPGIAFIWSSAGESHHKRWRIDECTITASDTDEYVPLKGIKGDKWFDSKKDAEKDVITQAYRYMEERGWNLKGS